MSQLRVYMVLLLSFILSALNLAAQPASSSVETNFKMGEELEFKIGYGWFTLGKASANIHKEYISYDEEECYKVEIIGQTDGLVGLFTHVKDTWGAFIEAGNLRPMYAYQDIEEGRYKRNEKTYYDHGEGKIRIIKNDQEKDPKTFTKEKAINDLLSAYLRIRTIDLRNFKKGDTTLIYTYYDGAFYNLVLKHDGKERVRTPFGKIDAHRVLILIPKNDVFPEEGGVVVWISADKSQLPLKIEAKMYFGKAFCDLAAYKNLKYTPVFD